MVENLWESHKANFESDLDGLVYRSNLLGGDRAIANWGGGNTSTKTIEKNFRGEDVEVMWVKGSGSDLATMDSTNFTALKMKDIRPLLTKDHMTDEEMVRYLSHCMIDSTHPRSSIETLLHAFLPFKHVDHTHPDAIISIACADNGKDVAEKIYGDRFVWLPYIRPGFDLSKMIGEIVKNNPQAELVIMEKHGLVTWGETSEASYNQTISVIKEAEKYIQEQTQRKEIFGGTLHKSLTKEERRDALAEVLPVVRGLVSTENKMIVTNNASEEVLNFVNSKDAYELSQVGAACPDHLVHTKRTPLFVSWNPQKEGTNELIESIKKGIENFREEYKSYFKRNQSENDTMFEPVPRVLLIPGIGMVNTGNNIRAAKVSESLFLRAISVMKGSTIIGEFTSLKEEEAFAVEYWPLELYKLSLAPAETDFSRNISFITGGAGGIGSSTCYHLASEGSHIVVADINLDGAKAIAENINDQFGAYRAIAVKMDVTKEEEVEEAVKEAILTFGGLDILVNNAGLASSSPFEETTLDKWNLNMNVLVTGYFLVAREAFKLMKNQSLGGNMVFVGSKNSIYAGRNAAAYSTAKAAELHLARTIAADGGQYGIRVNSVLPDAVIRGSKIWDSEWKEERASSYGIQAEELEEHYRKRTILNQNVLPEDIAESISFLASSKSAKTTGCMITVDGGVPAAFSR